jgi:2,4-dienoyl-CoA reductase-like NADH-dependent reductase (Old Yellow Enzyme family)
MPRFVQLGLKVVGRRVLREYPFEELYLLAQARRVREAVSLPLSLLGGVSSGEAVQRAMDEGFPLVSMGRVLLREPDFVNRLEKDRALQGTCTHCNRCMPTNYTGTRCVLDQPETPRTAGWRSGDTVVG